MRPISSFSDKVILERDNTGWVNLTGLEPDTRYFYRVRAPQSSRPREELSGSFRTLPNAGTYRHAVTNPDGRFNFRFEVGACNSQMRGSSVALPTLGNLLSRHIKELSFSIHNGDWIYEEKREYPVSAWLREQDLSIADVPPILEVAPVLAGVWENYKIYLERSANLRRWHRHIPSFYTFDDHELLGDITGCGNVGLRDRRAVFRDIGIRGWQDYLGRGNPIWHDEAIVFGRGRMVAGSDILESAGGLFAGLNLDLAGTLMVLWNEPTAGINDDIYDGVGGDPNAGVYEITEVIDPERLRLRPAARADGEVSFSIGKPQYTSFRVSNTEFFLIDTRSYRQLHELSNPFDPEVEFLGARQKTWLKEKMARSDAEILFIVSSVSVMLPHLEPRADTPEQANENDSWSAAGAERREMLDFWISLKKPVLLLTGDLHNSYVVKVTDNVWEFLAAPRNSHSTFSSDAGNPPPNGPFRWLDADVDIRWSTHVMEDTPKPRFNPTYCIVQVNNIYENTEASGAQRWVAFPRPQVVVQFYNGHTGELLYAESVPH